MSTVMLATSCGNKVELPQETRGGIIPEAGTYRVTQIWTAVPDAFDIVLTRGNLIFISEPDSGRVRGYFRSRDEATFNGIEMAGLGRPTFIAEGREGRLLVADEGDTTRILEFDLDSRPPALVNVFTHPAWDSLGGIEADDEGNLFVSILGDTDRVVQYDLCDGTSCDAQVRVREALEGSGTEFVSGPAGLARDGRGGLFAIDRNWIRRWTLTSPSTFDEDYSLSTSEGEFPGASDVAVDADGFFYIADTAGGRVLKYEGGDPPVLDLRVDEGVASPSEPGHLVTPRAIAVNSTQVYAVDPGTGHVVTFELD
jgi:hypothetical protein